MKLRQHLQPRCELRRYIDITSIEGVHPRNIAPKRL